MHKFRWVLLSLAVLVAAAVNGVNAVNAQVPGDKNAVEGWAALQRGDGESAAAAFDAALKGNPRDATLHLGTGAAAHLLGRDRDAAESLNRALTLNPRLIPAMVLLGEIEYLRGDSAAAIARYETALKFVTGDDAAEIRKRLARWQKEAAVNGTLSERSEARFSVVFDGRAENTLSAHTVALLERSFWRIAEKIGAYPTNRILVTLYTERQFRDMTQMPAWSAGAFDGKIRIPVQGVGRNMDEFDRVLVHELTHAMIFGLAPVGVPAWLHEGLASYFEARDPAAAQKHVQAWGGGVPLSVLQDSFGRFNVAQAALAYEESLVAADMLVRLLGNRMAVLLRGMGNGQSFEESLGQLGLPATEFEAQVGRRLKP
jgi:tetratricopeptide (TPR) repeat protein